MCGIFGYIGNINPDKDKLQQIAYLAGTRGCHSYGVSYISDGEIKTDKGLGKIPYKAISDTITSKTLIGHCRLCTVGKPTLGNAQPLATDVLSVAVNGTIRNYSEIIKRYNLHPTTTNDSEVLLLLATAIGSGNAIDLISGLTKDPFACLIMDRRSIVAYRRDIPLYADVTSNETYLCSRQFGNSFQLANSKTYYFHF